jgi:hypothetical protein
MYSIKALTSRQIADHCDFADHFLTHATIYSQYFPVINFLFLSSPRRILSLNQRSRVVVAHVCQ